MCFVQFSPKSASPGGLTTITINGINFGRIIRDGRVEVSVKVAGETCVIQRDDFKESEKWVSSARSIFKICGIGYELLIKQNIFVWCIWSAVIRTFGSVSSVLLFRLACHIFWILS